MIFKYTNIQLYQLFKDKIGEKEAEAMVTFVDERVTEGVKEATKQNLNVLTTKDDLAATNEKIANLRTELKTDNANMRAELKTEIANLRTELKTDNSIMRTELKTDIANLRTEIANTKAEMIKWMFLFWLGQLAASIAVAKFFFGK